MNLLQFPFRKYDWSFFGIAFCIFLIGIMNLYSATVENGVMSRLVTGQIFWFLIAMSVGIIISFIHPKNLSRIAYPYYLLNLILVFLVLVVGSKALGARRWLAIGPIRFQPSEMMKISIVLILSRWYSKVNPHFDVGLKEMIMPFLITFVPALLIIVEPDLGTGMVLLLVFFLMTFYRKLKWKSILVLFFIGIITSSVMYRYGLKEYQRQRIITFLDPWGDARGHGYNAIQSEIAIGSGQLLGKGLKKSSQASLHYLPENHTDFVFSVYNEEHGLLGSIVLITLYCILFIRYIWLSMSVMNFFDSLIVIGLMSIFFFHAMINMGMVTGLLPIVGIPLPLMSYGGSSLLTFGMCLGIATSISNFRNIF